MTEAGRIERESRSFIDYDEIASLLSGIDYVAKVDKSATKLDAFEAKYRTKGELEAIRSGRVGGATAFLTLDQLQSLRALVVEAKAKLDSL